MMSAFRHVVACFAMLAGGMVVCATGTAHAQGGDRSIGDPWWDDAVAPPKHDERAEDAVEHPIDALAQVQQEGARNPMSRREAAMTNLRRELSLVRATCPSLSPPQRRALVEAGLLAVEQGQRGGAGPDRVPLPQQVAPGVVLRVHVGGGTKQSDVAGAVENAVAKKVAEVASPDEAKEYRRELAARADRRRSAAMAVVIDTVDQTAMLDAEQRSQLARALEKKWQPFWDQAATQPGLTAARLPPGVAAVVADVLGPEDFKRWQERLRRLPGS